MPADFQPCNVVKDYRLICFNVLVLQGLDYIEIVILLHYRIWFIETI